MRLNTLHSPSSIRQFRPGALLIGRLDHCDQKWALFRNKYQLFQFQANRNHFLSECKAGRFDDVVALYRRASLAETGAFDEELISALPSRLKYICLNAAGYDGIDLKACAARGIRISNTPGVVNDSTADIAMFLLLGSLRSAMIPLNSIRSGLWKGRTPLGRDPQGKYLGILGMGGIGRAIATRARAFGLKVIYHNRRRLSTELEGESEYVSFEELLAQSDVISLNLTATSQTQHIIAKPQFQRMKPGVVIINTARGSLIKEEDLVDALRTGQVSSVGLDVFENEPAVHPELLTNERVMILPHTGTTTVETKTKMEALTLDNLESAIDNGELLTPIPEHER